MAVPYRLKKAFLNLLLTISSVYFYTIRFVFWFVNYFFRERVYVTPPTDRLLLISATQAVRMISKKEISSTALVESYIHRIEQVNNTINAAVIKLFDSARQQATEVDTFMALADEEDIQKKLEERPLYGVPFTMKDALEVENEIITCGIFNRKATKCDRTAEAIKRLKAAGGILLAVTNVPEVCMWVESVNTIYGRSKNPYDARRMTGGSSGGEGALLGAAGSVVGVGSDIGGSIRMPAFFNGVFGLKPTPGIIPLIGHVPEPTGYKTHMLRIGPMCRFAEDLPLMLRIMAGENARSLNLHEPVNGKKLRVFYMEGITGSPIIQPLEDEMRFALKKAVNFLERKYDIVAQRIELPSAKHVMEYFTLSMHEDTTDPAFNKLMLCTNGTKGEVNCYTELFKYFTGNSIHTLSGIIAGIIDSRDPPFSANHTKDLLYKRDRLKRQVKELLGNDGILLFPSWPCTAMFHNEPILAPFNFCYTALWNVLSVPVVQCPLGLDSYGLPLGVQVIGNQYTDRNLIAIAQVLEEGFNGWTPAGPL
ncbi:hypothetical protein GCK72_006644 [Caenorhabditis remanei]|uniref:Amidase domain-containing protein n=1 Tax=Caenorhabditis remanei TaxID=31234 RepID=A0A6A5HJ24_CAERE|nr:hypothetical protein GCK72_006644 [Caenorhabditis remanei]KAF1766686.1 hypothetical protein GCK72_006644 [Caenorhabditis remanei]